MRLAKYKGRTSAGAGSRTKKGILLAVALAFVVVNLMDFNISLPEFRVAVISLALKNHTRQDWIQVTKRVEEEKETLMLDGEADLLINRTRPAATKRDWKKRRNMLDWGAGLRTKEASGAATVIASDTKYPAEPSYYWNESLTEVQLSTGSLRYSNEPTRVVFDRLSILPLLEWEVSTIGNPNITRNWKPPNGNSHTTCAIGSLSTGGGVRVQPDCASGEVYQKVYQHALSELKETGICDVCRMVEQLAVTQQRLVLWGDSLQRQSFDGLICELERRQYRVVYHQAKKGQKGLFFVSDLTTVLVEVPNSGGTATLQYLAQYRPKDDAQTVYKESLEPYLFNHTLYQDDPSIRHVPAQPVVYLLSFGLHFELSRQNVYRPKMKAALGAIQLQHSSAPHRVMWRETTAQHFNNTLGQWSEAKKKELKGQDRCFPIAESNYTQHLDWGWHEHRVIYPMVQSDFGWKVVHSTDVGNNHKHNNTLINIPFRDFSAQFHRLHHYGECTHYCSTPHFWNYQWRHVRIAMENHFPLD